jgi:signal transduction histidine kinase
MNAHQTDSTLPQPALIAGGLVLLLLLSALAGSLLMMLPATVIERFVLSVAGVGISATLISYALYRSGWLPRLGSLRWLLVLLVGFTVGVIVLNTWLVSQIVFMDSYYLGLMVVVLGFAGLSAFSFGYFAARTMTDRLFALCEAADDVSGGDLGTRLDVQGQDEIAQLTRAFNEMARRLEDVDAQKRRLEQTRRDLVAWVSHDLRTPLTSMRVMLEALADGIIQDEATRTRYLRSSLAEIEHLSHLIDDLFELAQLDVGHLQLDYQQIAIDELLHDALSGMRLRAEQKQITLTGSVAADVGRVQIAPDKIQRVLNNLLENAIRYTPAGERVTVRVFVNADNDVQVDVQNTGVYIDDDTLPNLFQSFYRGDKSRAQTDNERGAGLGLAIARGFVQAHGGRIRAASDPAEGTTFSFTLPRSADTLSSDE